MHDVHTIFETNLLRIQDFRCAGEDSGGEEYSSACEIVFPRAGFYVRRDAAGSATADPNHVLFFHRNQAYAISHPLPGGDCSTEFTLESEALIDLLAAFDPSAADRPDNPFPASYAPIELRQRLVQFQLIRAARTDADPLAVEERVLLLLGAILHSVYHRTAQTRHRPSGRSHGHHEVVDHLKLALNARFRERLTLDLLARAVHTSPFHLCRVFKAETGLSIHQYLQRLRLLHALERLAEERIDDLTGLALELGFASHSHFTTAFRREFGAPPTAYRLTTSHLHEMRKILKA